MLAGVSVHVSPAGETAEVKATVPVNPLMGATVIVEAAAVPAVVVTLVGLADTLKSVNVKVTEVELVAVPLVAVTVATDVTAPVLVQVNVEVPLVPRTTLVGVSVHDAPLVADTVSATVPVKLPLAATVIVDEPPGAPTFAVTLVGLALRLMPGAGPVGTIVTDTDVELVISLFVPPVPLMTTV